MTPDETTDNQISIGPRQHDSARTCTAAAAGGGGGSTVWVRDQGRSRLRVLAVVTAKGDGRRDGIGGGSATGRSPCRSGCG
jgi:hypothetical protein